MILGNEAAGIVTSAGAGVTGIRPGDRVAYVGVGGPFYENTGSYAEERNVPAACLIKLPDGISDRQAAALLLKGLTASLVINRIYKPKAGDAILVHAAASGVGMLLCQWAKHLGATVIGTVGSSDKAKIVLENGCDHAILYRETDFVCSGEGYRSARRACRVRRRGGRHVHSVIRLHGTVRHARELRECLGARATRRSVVAREERLALGVPSGV